MKTLAREESLDLRRLRRQAAFDRLLCRLFVNPDAPWLPKRGDAMELRLKTARTTRDIDLALKRLPGGPGDLQDFFTLVVAKPRKTWTPHFMAAPVFRWMRDWPNARS